MTITAKDWRTKKHTPISAVQECMESGKKIPLLESIIAEDAQASVLYSRKFLQGPFIQGEPAIARSGEWSIHYANNVLMKRFPKGEPAIVKEAKRLEYFRQNASNFLERRWRLLEEALLENPKKLECFEYMKIVGKLLPEFQSIIDEMLESPQEAFMLVRDIVKKRFKPAENIIATDAFVAIEYATKYLKGEFTKAEKKIAESAYESLVYAREIKKGRFELGEKAIAEEPEYSISYALFRQEPFELGEKAIAKRARSSYTYATVIKKGRFELGEEAIAVDPYFATRYAIFLNTPFPLAEPVIKSVESLWREYKQKFTSVVIISTCPSCYKIGQHPLGIKTTKCYSCGYEYDLNDDRASSRKVRIENVK